LKSLTAALRRIAEKLGNRLCGALAIYGYFKMTENFGDKIRDLVNTSPRIFARASIDNKSWNHLCSSMDVLGDAEMGIWEFQNQENVGYIAIYGLLQALFLQQDAVKFIANVVGAIISDSPELDRIRNIRNDAVGHPMNRRAFKSFHYISRSSISKQGFSMMSHDVDTGKDSFYNINLQEILETQKYCINKQLGEIYCHMKNIENSHREEHSDEKLTEIFHPSLGYLFQKIYSSFHDKSRIGQAQTHVPMIRDMVLKFKNKLHERGELESNYYADDNIQKFLYAAGKLEKYLKELDSKKDAAKNGEIFCEYIETRVEKLKMLAKEIDEEYESRL